MGTPLNNKKNITLKNGDKYVLDSAQLIDWNYGRHFSSLITINNEEYGYDGASLTKLVRFKWSKKLNKDYDWTYPYDDTNDILKFNFEKSYQILYYYRVK